MSITKKDKESITTSINNSYKYVLNFFLFLNNFFFYLFSVPIHFLLINASIFFISVDTFAYLLT